MSLNSQGFFWNGAGHFSEHPLRRCINPQRTWHIQARYYCLCKGILGKHDGKTKVTKKTVLEASANLRAMSKSHQDQGQERSAVLDDYNVMERGKLPTTYPLLELNTMILHNLPNLHGEARFYISILLSHTFLKRRDAPFTR